jgi:hypothetical protein
MNVLVAFCLFSKGPKDASGGIMTTSESVVLPNPTTSTDEEGVEARDVPQ